MKILGVIGGIAPGSTIDYYRLLVAEWRARTHDGSYPPIVINSIDLNRLWGYVTAGRTAELADYLAAEIERLERAGATVGLLSSNTPHMIFDELRGRSPIPLVSIVEASCAAALELGYTTLGLLGTRFTMEGAFYSEVFARHDLRVLPPGPADLEYVHQAYVNELIPGDFRPGTRDRFLEVIARLASAGAGAVLLAGTELPMLLRGAEGAALPLVDTTAIHVRRAIGELLA